MDRKNISRDEARCAAQVDAMKAQVANDVGASIGRRAVISSTPESQRLDKVAGALRSEAIDGVVGADRHRANIRGLARAAQFINYAFAVLYTLLAVRLLLALAAARSSAGFVQLINALTNPFYAMFRGIVASPTREGGHELVLPILVAMAAYALLHSGVLGLVRLFAHRRTEI